MYILQTEMMMGKTMTTKVELSLYIVLLTCTYRVVRFGLIVYECVHMRNQHKRMHTENCNFRALHTCRCRQQKHF